jgi:hypothetical protein
MEIKETILKELEKIEFCSITTDGWSSKFQKKAFISLTIHYLDEHFKPVKISLGIIPADHNHNAQNLAKHLKALLCDHKIKKKCKVMVVDHASTMGEVCNLLDYDFYGCFNHFLNLVCTMFFNCFKIPKSSSIDNDEIIDDNDENWEDIEKIDPKKKIESFLNGKASMDSDLLEIIEEETEEQLIAEEVDFNSKDFDEIGKSIATTVIKMKKVITAFNKSNDLTRDLIKVQKEAHAYELLLESDEIKGSSSKSIFQLIQDVITRWNSKCLMIERYLKVVIFLIT